MDGWKLEYYCSFLFLGGSKCLFSKGAVKTVSFSGKGKGGDIVGGAARPQLSSGGAPESDPNDLIVARHQCS